MRFTFSAQWSLKASTTQGKGEVLWWEEVRTKQGVMDLNKAMFKEVFNAGCIVTAEMEASAEIWKCPWSH